MKSVVLYNIQLFKRSEEPFALYETPLPSFHLITWISFPLSVGWLWRPFFFFFIILHLKFFYVYVSLVTSASSLLHISCLLSYYFASLYFSGRNNIFPTLFLLWRCPHAIRTFVIHAPVSGQNHSQQLLCFFSSVKLVIFHHYHDSLRNHFTLSLIIWFQREAHIFSYDLKLESAIWNIRYYKNFNTPYSHNRICDEWSRSHATGGRHSFRYGSEV